MFSEDPPRLGLTGVAEMDDAQRRLHDAIASGPRRAQHQQGTVPIMDESGRLLGPFAVMLQAPAVGGPLQEVGAALRFASSLTGREREAGILAVAAAHRCGFEWRAHEAAAQALGFTAGQLADIADGRVPGDLSEPEALVCRLAAKMARDRALTDCEYDCAVALLGTAKLAEVTWLVGYYGALALALAVFRPAAG